MEKNGKDYNGCSGHSGRNTHCWNFPHLSQLSNYLTANVISIQLSFLSLNLQSSTMTTAVSDEILRIQDYRCTSTPNCSIWCYQILVSWTGLQGYNTLHIVQLKGNVSTSFLTSFVNRQLPHSKRISKLSKQRASQTVHYIFDLPHAIVLRNTITTISIHILLRTKKKLLQSYLLIRYQSIGRKCNGQYEMRNTTVSISGTIAKRA